VAQQAPLRVDPVIQGERESVRHLEVEARVARWKWRIGEGQWAGDVVFDRRTVGHPQLRFRSKLKDGPQVVAPGGIAALDAGRALPSTTWYGEVVERTGEFGVDRLVVEPEAERYHLIELVRNRRIDVEGRNIRFDRLEPSHPGRVVFGLQPEGHAHSDADLPIRRNIHGEIDVRNRREVSCVPAVVSQRLPKAWSGTRVAEFRAQVDERESGRDLHSAGQQAHAGGVVEDGARI